MTREPRVLPRARSLLLARTAGFIPIALACLGILAPVQAIPKFTASVRRRTTRSAPARET